MDFKQFSGEAHRIINTPKRFEDYSPDQREIFDRNTEEKKRRNPRNPGYTKDEEAYLRAKENALLTQGELGLTFENHDPGKNSSN